MMKIIKDAENEYYIQVKRKNSNYPFTIHKRFYTRESAMKFIKLNRKKYK